MTKKKSLRRPDRDLEAEALTALEEARALSHGPERTRAMQKAGKLPGWLKISNDDPRATATGVMP